MVKKNGGLQVINASFNKTGTKTIHSALEILGHKVCDAQESVYRHYEDWQELWDGKDPGKIYRKMFAPNNPNGYTSCCDTPFNVLWESLHDEFPDAKVIMVIRDEDKWVESFRKFFEVEQRDFAEMKWHRLYGPIYRFFFPHSSAPMRVYMDFLRVLVLGPEVDKFYGYNKTLCLKHYREHNNYVLNKCPKDKLLVYKFSDGWEPLCKFLGEPVPDAEFPWSNRMGSVIAELSEHPDYLRVMKRQLLCLFIRLVMVIGFVYLYLYRYDCVNSHLDETWKKLLAIFVATYIFHKA